ncbi:MAG: hypothetical protein LQ346_001332 [Caloplaca aetnensis]|nr:MAG: hypothetical protein LQ346_001332 [Caloplaca aetnensis]
MTQRDTLTSVHEPFGDAFYYGPERLSARYVDDPEAREASGFSQSTYQTILERFEREEASEGKRLFIKDIAYYLIPPDRKPASTAPSLGRKKRGVGTSALHVNGAVDGTTPAPYPHNTDIEPNNPTVLPIEIMGNFHFTFLIRHPRCSIPSFYRCTIPPLDKVTGFYNYMPSEAGYDELRRLFDYLRSAGLVGPKIAGQSEINGHARSNGATRGVELCVVDADDLLDNPSGIIEAYCRSVGLDYDPGMLKWDTEEDQQHARDAFEKWPGFHEDVMDSKMLKPREHIKKTKSVEEEDRDWAEKYGEKGAKIIRETVNANLKDYEYLKQFAIKV